MNTVMVRQSIKIAFMYLHSQSVGKETNSYCLEMSYEMNSHYILCKIIFGPLEKKKQEQVYRMAPRLEMVNDEP